MRCAGIGHPGPGLTRMNIANSVREPPGFVMAHLAAEQPSSPAGETHEQARNQWNGDSFFLATEFKKDGSRLVWMHCFFKKTISCWTVLSKIDADKGPPSLGVFKVHPEDVRGIAIHPNDAGAIVQIKNRK
jgi:hypothetical protein